MPASLCRAWSLCLCLDGKHSEKGIAEDWFPQQKEAEEIKAQAARNADSIIANAQKTVDKMNEETSEKVAQAEKSGSFRAKSYRGIVASGFPLSPGFYLVFIME